MPIKFRCSYCRQFLGISRNRVGSIVDCPTCGRSIRVPGTDGIAAPLPTPELDRDDAHLARALDELAALVEAPLNRPAMAVVEDFTEDTEIPQPLPEPEPVELPMPIRIAPVTVLEPISSPTTIADEGAGRTALETLIPTVTATSNPIPVVSTLSPRWMLTAALIHTATLLGGIVIGWKFFEAPSTTPVNLPPATAHEPVAHVQPTDIEGRVTYRTSDEEIRADEGALVVLLRDDWSGRLRLPPTGLRPGDDVADQAAALVAAGAFGGAARTDGAGRYRLPVSQPGRYRVVIISRFAERPEAEPLADETQSTLATFLADPAATVGLRAVYVTQVTVKADQTTALDHGF